MTGSRVAFLGSAIVLASLGGEPLHAQSHRAERAQRLVRRGQARIAAGDAGSALAYLRRAIDVDPRSAVAYRELAQVYLAQGRSSDALEVLRVAAARCPRDVPLQLLRARALESRGAVEEAAAVLRALVAAVPRSPAAHRERAMMAERRGAWSEALGAYRALLSLAAEGAEIDEEGLRQARAHVAALELLTRRLDPVRSCEPGPVRAALCRRD